MKIDIEHKDNIVILKIDGEIDMGNADTFISEINKFEREKHKLIFDFTQVNFVNSIGIGILIRLKRFI